MLFVISAASTPDIGLELGILAKVFQGEIMRILEGKRLNSPLRGIVIFPTILKPDIASMTDKVMYKRGDGSVFVSINLPYDQWCASGRPEKIDLLSETLLASLKRIEDSKLTPGDRCTILNAVEQARGIIQNTSASASERKGSESFS